VVRVPKAVGAVIDPGIPKSEPAIARQIALPIGVLNGLPSGLLPVLPIGVVNGRRIALRSGSRIGEATALRTVAQIVTWTVPMNAMWTARTIVIEVQIADQIADRNVLLSDVPIVGIGS
jgi:hypothetical protein